MGWKDWLTKPIGPAAPEPMERFGDVEIERSAGEQYLRASLERKNLASAIRDRVPDLSAPEKCALVDRLLARLALYVFDLPASERHHHAYAGGLLDHLLEVAARTVETLARPSFRVSPDPSIDHRERAPWVYAGLVGAIGHDLGKVFDCEVVLPEGGEAWDPKEEPLVAFCRRAGLAESGPSLWKFRKGRGRNGHEARNTEALEILLTPDIVSYLGPRWAAVQQAFENGREKDAESGVPEPARQIVDVVRAMDQMSTKDDRAAAEPAEGPAETPQAAPPPPPLPPVALVSVPPPPPPTPDRVRQPWEDGLPWVPKRGGDPTEQARRAQVELDPAEFLGHVHRYILRRLLSRNDWYSDIYIRPDFVWLTMPQTFERLARLLRLPRTIPVCRAMITALRSTPFVIAESEERVLFHVRVRPDADDTWAVKMRRPGFISDTDLAKLGVHPHEVTVIQPTLFPLPLSA